ASRSRDGELRRRGSVPRRRRRALRPFAPPAARCRALLIRGTKVALLRLMRNVTDLVEILGGRLERPRRAAIAPGWTLVTEFDHGGKHYALVVCERESVELTPREREVITRACVGQTNKVIAFDLGVSDSTVRVFMARACAKLGVRTRAQAIAAYRESTSHR